MSDNAQTEVNSVSITDEDRMSQRLSAFGASDEIIGCVDWSLPSTQMVDALDIGPDSLVREIGTPVMFSPTDVRAELLDEAITAVVAAGFVPAVSCRMEDGPFFVLLNKRGFIVRGRYVRSRMGGFYAMVQGERGPTI